MTDKMAAYIARAIIRAERTNPGSGAALYRSYFVALDTWDEYQAATDTILITEGYGQCIVTA
jgi:hypothetical protein